MTTTVRSRRPRVAAAGWAPVRGLVPLGVLLVVWQIVGMVAPSPFFPPPTSWPAALTSLLPGGALAQGILSTLVTFAESLVIAFVLGSALGILIGRNRVVSAALAPLLDFFRYLPAVALVPLIVLFAGYTQTMKIYVVVFGAIWPILLQVRLVAGSLDPILDDVRRVLGLSRGAGLAKIVIPAILPGALLGLRLASPLTLILVLVVEISTQVSGLGRMLGVAQQSYLPAQVFGLIVIIGVIAILIDLAISIVERWALRYRPRREP